MKKARFLWLAALLWMGAGAEAQRSIVATPQDNVKLLWGMKNLSVVDGKLYGSSNGVMVSSELGDEGVSVLRPDTLAHYLGSGYSYVVRNPQDGLLYFSHMDPKKGRYGLYVHVNNKRKKNQRVDVRNWNLAIYHPTFSTDGNLMVFSSQSRIGLGGYDLWCSFRNGKGWTKPINMGNAVNTEGNEINPVFYGDYLVFSSNRKQDGATYSFYSIRIKPGSKVDNLLFDTYQVQPLPPPLNSDSNDIELAFDSTMCRGYWVTDRGGKEELYGFVGRLDGVMLEGRVTDEKGRAVAQAMVKVAADGRTVNSALTDKEGQYSLFVQPREHYQLSVSRRNYFTHTATVQARRFSEDCLVAKERHDVTLSYLPFNRTMIFDHIYAPGADVELSEEGKRALEPLVAFLRDNPHVGLILTLQCTETTDSVFNNLLIEQRISDLRQYFISTLSSDRQITFLNGNIEGKIEVPEEAQNVVFAVLSKSAN